MLWVLRCIVVSALAFD